MLVAKYDRYGSFEMLGVPVAERLNYDYIGPDYDVSEFVLCGAVSLYLIVALSWTLCLDEDCV